MSVSWLVVIIVIIASSRSRFRQASSPQDTGRVSDLLDEREFVILDWLRRLSKLRLFACCRSKCFSEGHSMIASSQHARPHERVAHVSGEAPAEARRVVSS